MFGDLKRILCENREYANIYFLISFLLYSTEEEDSWSSGSTVGSEDDSDETIEFGRYSGVTS